MWGIMRWRPGGSNLRKMRMLPILRRYALIALLAACRVPRPVVPSEESRIARIEENLLPAVMIEGRGGGRPIAERMEAHRVPGVAIAVLDEARVIWTRGHGDTTAEARLPVADLGVPLAAPEIGRAHV